MGENEGDDLATTLYKLNKSTQGSLSGPHGCETPAITRKKFPLIPLNRRPTVTTTATTTSDSSDNDVESVIPRGMKKSTCTLEEEPNQDSGGVHDEPPNVVFESPQNQNSNNNNNVDEAYLSFSDEAKMVSECLSTGILKESCEMALDTNESLHMFA